MIIDLLKLRNNIEKIIEINETITFDEDKIKQTDLIDLKNTKIIGEITKDSLENIQIYLKVTGTMILPCAITLEPVNHDFEFEIEENIEDLVVEEQKNSKKVENTIDILPIIWENILMEIPMRVVSENAQPEKLQGDGWKFITETTKNTNPELEKLKELL